MNWIQILLCCSFDVVGTLLGNLRDEIIESLKNNFWCHFWRSNSCTAVCWAEVIAMDVKLMIQLLEEKTAIYTEEKKQLSGSSGTVWWTRSGVWDLNDWTGTTWKETGLCQGLRHSLPHCHLPTKSKSDRGKRERRKSIQWEPISIFTNCKSCCESDNWVNVIYC